MNGQAGWAKTGRNASARPAHTEWAQPARKPLARRFPPDGIAERYACPSPLALQRQRARASSAREYQNKSKSRGQKCQFAQIALGPHAMNKGANQGAGKWAYSAYPATRRQLRGGPGCRCQRGRRCLRRQSHSPAFAGSRSSRRSTLPTGDLGRLARNSMREGRL